MVKGLLKRGVEVTVLTFREKRVRCRVWKDIEDVVLICSEEEYQRALADQKDALYSGVPKEDILEVHDTQGVEGA